MEIILEELNKDNDVGIGEKTRLVGENVSKLNFFASFKGIFLAMIASLFSAILLVVAKLTTEVTSTQKTQVTLIQTAFYAFIAILISRDFNFFNISKEAEVIDLNCNSQHENPSKTVSKLIFFLVLSGVANSTAQFLYYLALQNLPIGEATVIRLSTTVFVFLLGKVFLGESIGCFNAIMLVMSIIGITLVSKIEFIFGTNTTLSLESEHDSSLSMRLYSIFSLICGSFLISVGMIIRRKLMNISAPFYVYIDSMTGSIVFMLVITISSSKFKYDVSNDQWLLMMLLGLLYFLEVMSYNVSLKYENANLCSLIRSTTRVMFGFLFQFTFFDAIPDGWTMTGAIIVTTSVSLISLRKLIESRKNKNLQ